PHLHDTRSTLAQELDLCRAYLDIGQSARSTPSLFAIEAPEVLATASVPAMVLLPLVAHAVACADPARDPSLSLRADFHTDRLRIVEELLPVRALGARFLDPVLRNRLRGLEPFFVFGRR